MDSKVHIAPEDLALYAMGNLQGEERSELRCHLQVCAACREELRSIAGDLAVLALAVEQHPVSERARTTFVEKIAEDAEHQK